jgi:drug/metabolite transporter (DMT)-like permease
VLIFSIEPVIASLIASAALGEQLGTPGIIGGGLILLGVLLSELSEQIPWLKSSVAARRA